MASLTVSGARKAFGKKRALESVDFHVEGGELCVIVGPAGSGKTTLLRAIAGLETLDAGNIAIDDELVNDLRARDRDVAMVFQRPTLFSYLNVRENIAFGLRARKVARAEVLKRVQEAAKLVGVSELLRRRPRHLSEDERQGVAIAHAVVRDALLYLLDEPLAPYDSIRRAEIRAALKALQAERGMTAVIATRDPADALRFADRVVVLNEGCVEQQGTPAELIAGPTSRFVADFFETPRMQFFAGDVSDDAAIDTARKGGVPEPDLFGEPLRDAEAPDAAQS